MAILTENREAEPVSKAGKVEAKAHLVYIFFLTG